MPERGPKRVFEDVVQKIRIDIARGRIKPGDKLPTDRGLVNRFGVGRGSIREAIRALELFGLVSVKRGRDGGSFFTADCVVLARASASELTIVKSTVADGMEFRKALEPKAAALAARRATEDDLRQLRDSIGMMAREGNSDDAFVEGNRLFHETIARATRNPYCQDFIPQFLERPEVAAATRDAETIDRALTQFFHSRIVDAVAKRDPDAAEFWMLGHLSQIEEDLSRVRALAEGRQAG